MDEDKEMNKEIISVFNDILLFRSIRELENYLDEIDKDDCIKIIKIIFSQLNQEGYFTLEESRIVYKLLQILND